MENSITSTEFQTKAAQYIDGSSKSPVFITRYGRPIKVLLNIDEYNRLKKCDTRETLYPHELNDDLKSELARGYKGIETPELNHLIEP
jgi:prevent-host-death family protein